MKVTPSRDFLYSLNGIAVTSYKEGVAVNIPDEVVEKLQIAGGYLEGFDKEVKAVVVETSDETKDETEDSNQNDTKTVDLLSIVGMKKNFPDLLKLIGIETVEQLKAGDVKEIAALDGISIKIAEQLVKAEVK